jgi:hypothetical protein
MPPRSKKGNKRRPKEVPGEDYASQGSSFQGLGNLKMKLKQAVVEDDGDTMAPIDMSGSTNITPDERLVTDESDREKLLNQGTVPTTKRAIWMDESIIAERTAKTAKEQKKKEYLNTPQPVWRRRDDDYGVDRGLVIDWERLKRRNGTIEIGITPKIDAYLVRISWPRRMLP